MTRTQAIEESIAIWEHLSEDVNNTKPIKLFLVYSCGCPLCELYNNPKIAYSINTQKALDEWQEKRCLDCPLYDGVRRSTGCCFEYKGWVLSKQTLRHLRAEKGKSELHDYCIEIVTKDIIKHAKNMVALLKGALANEEDDKKTSD